MERSQSPNFIVGEWVVRPSLNRIDRNGHRVSLQPLAVALLGYFAQYPGKVITTDELITHVWRGQIVSDGTVYHWIHRLRKALGDDSRHPRYIETIPKKGYRLLARVRISESRDAEDSARVRRRWIVPAATVALLVSLVSVAYLLTDVLTKNPRAYDAYTSGNYYHRRNEPSLAVQQYQRAVEEDPDFALAWAKLSMVYSEMYFFDPDQTESLRAAARNAVDRAFELAPDLPEAHLAKGHYYYHGFREYDKALEEWAIAEQGMPRDSRLYGARARVYRRMGESGQAAKDMDRAVELDPGNLDLLVTQALIYESLREYTQAEQILDDILEIAPDNGNAPLRRSLIRLFRGDAISAEAAREFSTGVAWLAAVHRRDYGAALEFLDEWEIEVLESPREYRPKATYYAVTYQLAEMPDLAASHLQLAHARIKRELETRPEDPRLLIALGEVVAQQGEAESARGLARKAMQLPSASADMAFRPAFHLNTIMIFVAAGDYDLAIKELDLYLSGPGEWSVEGLWRDPRLDPLRYQTGFQALVKKWRRP